HFRSHFGDSGLVHIDFARGGQRKIENPVGDERAAVGNTHQRRVSLLQIGNTYDGTQRQRAMRRRHGVHVVDFAIRSHTVVVRRTVPTGAPGFHSQRRGARRNRGLGEVGAAFFDAISCARLTVLLRRPRGVVWGRGRGWLVLGPR